MGAIFGGMMLRWITQRRKGQNWFAFGVDFAIVIAALLLAQGAALGHRGDHEGEQFPQEDSTGQWGGHFIMQNCQRGTRHYQTCLAYVEGVLEAHWVIASMFEGEAAIPGYRLDCLFLEFPNYSDLVLEQLLDWLERSPDNHHQPFYEVLTNAAEEREECNIVQ